MDLSTLLITNDKEEVINNLYTIRQSLTTAVHDYADDALEFSHMAFLTAQEGGPAIEALQDLALYEKTVAKCLQTNTSVQAVTTMLLALEETTDAEVDEANNANKAHTLQITKVSALLEAAHNRAMVASATIPPNATPGMRCDSTKLTVTKT